MRVTQRLNAEHGVFLSLLEQIDGLVARHAPPEVIAAVTRAVLDVIEPHCRIEDEWLYPTLRDAFGRDFPPLAGAEDDHAEVERLSRDLEGGADLETIVALVAVLRRHIEKEIHLVFPLADEWIPDDTLSRMCDWYADHVRERAHRPPPVAPFKQAG